MHRIDGRPAHAQAVRIGEARPKPLEIDLLGNLPQIMARRHYRLEDLPIEFRQAWHFCKDQHGSQFPRYSPNRPRDDLRSYLPPFTVPEQPLLSCASIRRFLWPRQPAPRQTFSAVSVATTGYRNQSQIRPSRFSRVATLPRRRIARPWNDDTCTLEYC